MQAQQEAERLAHDLLIQPDAIAAIVRNRDGKFKVHSTAHPVDGGTMYGMFWGLLFGLLFFVPFFGLAVGAGMGALMGKIEKSGVDKEFQRQVQELLKPGTSALFLVVEKVTPDAAVDALSRFGGTVSATSLSKEAEAELQAELGGTSHSRARGHERLTQDSEMRRPSDRVAAGSPRGPAGQPQLSATSCSRSASRSSSRPRRRTARGRRARSSCSRAAR